MIILDRLEETLAVLETDDGMVNVPRELLPADVREGDVLRQTALTPPIPPPPRLAGKNSWHGHGG